MKFLNESDFIGIIAQATLDQLKGENNANLKKAELLAISKVAPLRDNYSIDIELAKAGTARNDELVRILSVLTAYYLFNTVEDTDIPDRIHDNYNDEYKAVLAIAVGKQHTTIPRHNNTDGTPRHNFRSGGDKPRSLDPYYR